MAIVAWALCPHPPLLVPAVGQNAIERVHVTARSVRRMADAVVRSKPKRLILFSPHAPSDGRAVTYFDVNTLSGTMERFGHPEVTLKFTVDREFSSRFADKCRENDWAVLPVTNELATRCGLALELDHGAFVPLYFIHEAGLAESVSLVLISSASNDYWRYYQMGQQLAELLRDDPVPTAIIASGDLSHKLLTSGPYGFDAQGPVFDNAIVKILQDADVEALHSLPQSVVGPAAQCGLPSIEAMFGSMKPAAVEKHFLSYEGPFGVGYGVSFYVPKAPVEELSPVDEAVNEVDGENEAPAELEDSEVEALAHSSADDSANEGEAKAAVKTSLRRKKDLRVRLARRTVEEFVKEGTRPEVSELVTEETAQPAAAFVTIKKAGQLRGCIGTLMPTCPNLLAEIVQNAVSACSRDPRFSPISAEELPLLSYQVSVLSAPVRVNGCQELDPRRYGVIVRKNGRSGVLLPDLEGVDTVEMQIAIACQKGGILPSENPELFRFETVTYDENK